MYIKIPFRSFLQTPKSIKLCFTISNSFNKPSYTFNPSFNLCTTTATTNTTKKKKFRPKEKQQSDVFVTKGYLKYIRECGHFNETIFNASDRTISDELTPEQLNISSHSQFKDEDSNNIPSILYALLNRTPKSNAILEKCDVKLASKSLQFPSSLKILDVFMLHFGDQSYWRVINLNSYIPLMEITLKSLLKHPPPIKYPLIHLAFLGSLSKKQSTDILDEILTFCTRNPQLSYKSWSVYEMGLMLTSFFRCGIVIRDPQFLNECADTLKRLFENPSDFDFSVLISILKVFRQADFYEQGLPELLYEKLLCPESSITSLINLTSLSHISATLLRWRREKDRDFFEDAFTKIEDRMREILEDEDGSKIRYKIKDFSRWLWAVAHLNLKITPTTHQLVLNTFDLRDICFDPASTNEMLLALLMMGHSIDRYLNLIIPSDKFAQVLQEECLSRQKDRLGLVLFALKLEGGLDGFPIENIKRLEKIVGTKEEDWRDLLFRPRASKENHSDLVNKIMRLSKIAIKGSSVHRGFPVPFLNIPGIKLEANLTSHSKLIMVEVINESFSPGLYEFKLRLLKRMGYKVFQVWEKEIENAEFQDIFKRLVGEIKN